MAELRQLLIYFTVIYLQHYELIKLVKIKEVDYNYSRLIDPILIIKQRQIFYGYINGSSIDLYMFR